MVKAESGVKTEKVLKDQKELTRDNLALLVIVVGVLMAAVDTTIVVLALPQIQKALKVPLSEVVWVIISYLLVITVLATQVGKLGDMFGRVKSYEAGFLIFIIGSALCALAFNEWSMIVFRVIQGIGGALLTANSGAVIADTFPAEKRGRAYGFNAIGWNVGAILGILLGGLIINFTSWRWIFWINVPAGIFSFLLALRVLHDKGQKTPQRFDIPGMIFLAVGLFGVLWGITKLSTQSLSAAVLAFLIIGIVFLAAFVAIELNVSAPMLNFKLFRYPTVTPTLLASFFQAVANFAVLFLVIMYLQGVRNLSPLHASLLLVPGYLLGGISGPLGGRLADKVGAVFPATLGLAIEIVALIIYSELTPTTPLWVIVVASVVNGIGGGLFFPANTSAIMKAVPGTVFGIASGILRTFANVGMVFSFAVSILIAGRSIPKKLAFAIFVGTHSLKKDLASAFSTSTHAAFYASAVFMAVAALLSATRIIAHLNLRKNRNEA